MNDWFKIEIIYPQSINLSGEELDNDDSWRVPKDDDLYLTDIGYFDLTADPIAQLNPRCFLPSNGKNKKYFTEVVFLSGNVSYAVGKPDAVWQKVSDYLKGQG